MVTSSSFEDTIPKRATVLAKQKVTKRCCQNKTWLLISTLTVTIVRWLVATAEGADRGGAFTNVACASTKSRCAVSKKPNHIVNLTDDACAFTKSRCAVSNKKRGVLFWMSLAPPRNHVAQCPKNRTTSLILPMTLAPSLSHVAQCPT